MSEPAHRLMLCEDDPMAARLFAECVVRDPALAYVGTAVTLTSAVELARHSQPQIILLDVNMPDGDGIEYADALRAAVSPTKIVAWTGRSDPAVVLRVQRSRLQGAVHKLDVATLEDFLSVLSAIRQQVRYFSPRISRVAEQFHHSDSFTKKLSDTELMLLPHFGKYLSDVRVASQVGLKPSTVHSHRTSIMAKLNVRTSGALVAWRVEHGFIDRRTFVGFTFEA